MRSAQRLQLGLSGGNYRVSRFGGSDSIRGGQKAETCEGIPLICLSDDSGGQTAPLELNQWLIQWPLLSDLKFSFQAAGILNQRRAPASPGNKFPPTDLLPTGPFVRHQFQVFFQICSIVGLILIEPTVKTKLKNTF